MAKTILSQRTISDFAFKGLTIEDQLWYQSTLSQSLSGLLVVGEEYIVTWDGTTYTLTCKESYLGVGLGLPNDGVPFGIIVMSSETTEVVCLDSESHTIGVYQEKSTPNVEYNGTIDLISGLRPKNNGTFPLVNAQDVQMPDGSRLSAIVLPIFLSEDAYNALLDTEAIDPDVPYFIIEDEKT